MLLILIAPGCAIENIEAVIVHDYKAPAPVVCISNTPKYNNLHACRDGHSKFWICSTGGSCMPVDYPQSMFADPTAEATK